MVKSNFDNLELGFKPNINTAKKDSIHKYIDEQNRRYFVKPGSTKDSKTNMYSEWFAVVKRMSGSYAVFHRESNGSKSYIPDAYQDRYNIFLSEYEEVMSKFCIESNTLWDDWPSDDLEHIFDVKPAISYSISELDIRNLKPEQIEKLEAAAEEFHNKTLSEMIESFNTENSKPKSYIDQWIERRDFTPEEEIIFRYGARFLAKAFYDSVCNCNEPIKEHLTTIEEMLERLGIKLRG